MAVSYGKFEMPEKIKIEESKEKKNFARVVAEPFERGFGYTLGNALRRTMLTALESPALISVKIEGASHEYMPLDGIIEDMTNIILNLKGALLRYIPIHDEENPRGNRSYSHVLDITNKQLADAGGAYKVTVKDILGDSIFEIINPDDHIMTVTKPMTKRIEYKVAFGRGYVPAERIELERTVDEIVLDAAFSPVVSVNYFVEDTRVGQDTDYDRLVFEITTDGRITPREALVFATQIISHHFSVFDSLKQQDLVFEEEQEETTRDREELLGKLALKINEIELSVRSTNCLAGADIATIGELVVMPESEMLKFRNFGKKSLTEIKQKLVDMGLSLGMDLSKYGINSDNIKDIIQQYTEEKSGNGEAS